MTTRRREGPARDGTVCMYRRKMSARGPALIAASGVSTKGQNAMLLWETLYVRPEKRQRDGNGNGTTNSRTRRLPFDRRCSALTKSGKRCRGRIREGTEFCPFHDPAVSRERRRQIASKGGRRRRRLAHLPDGYLRRLTSRRAVGDAMDRLYREVRLGVITPEMGTVLFRVLTRILDSGLCDSAPTRVGSSGRSKTDRIRPKLSELLTRAERTAWRRAVANAQPAVDPAASPNESLSLTPGTDAEPEAATGVELPTGGRALQLAS
jgi:hypothetical protein